MMPTADMSRLPSIASFHVTSPSHVPATAYPSAALTSTASTDIGGRNAGQPQTGDALGKALASVSLNVPKYIC